MSRQHPSQASSERRRGAARVSVVVPSYNHAPFVASALRSVFRQTLRPAELLVIDDGSADDSARVAGGLLKDCPFPCELIARENRGLCATLNEGLSKTRGEYFAYLGSDDLWLPGFLAARVSLLGERARAVLAYGHALLIDERGEVFDCTADWAEYADGDARAMLFERTTAPMSPTVLYRREPRLRLDDRGAPRSAGERRGQPRPERRRARALPARAQLRGRGRPPAPRRQGAGAPVPAPGPPSRALDGGSRARRLAPAR